MKSQHKVILAGLVGNLVEAYDIAICGYMAFYLSKYLTNPDSNNVGLVFTLFFIAYIARPLGALLLGGLSDIFGRKNVMMLSIIIMGLSTTCIAAIPEYSHIGFYATFSLLMLRVIQSLACGAEFLNSASYLVESGKDDKKGFRGSFTSVGVMSGILIASIITELTNLNASPITEAWLWRIPFIIAGITTLVGFYIRNSVPEGLQYVLYYSDKKKPSVTTLFKSTIEYFKQKPFLIYFAFATSFLNVGITFLLYIYIPIHAKQHHSLSTNQVFLGNILSLMTVIGLVPLFGYLQDKIDRLQMIKWATIGLLIGIYPFVYTLNYSSYSSFLTTQLLLSVPTACYFGVASVLLTDLFPLQIRCTVLSLTYSLAASLAGGLIPLLAMGLVNKTHILTSPSWIIIVLACIAMLNFILLHKNYRIGKNDYNQLSTATR